MKTLTASVFSTLTPKKSAKGSFLEAGKHIVKVSAISEETPAYEKEVYETDAGKIVRISDNYKQIKVTTMVEGIGTNTTYLSAYGNIKIDMITWNDVPADYDFSVVNLTKAAATKLSKSNWEGLKSQLFYESASGYAVRKDNGWRVTDFVAEEDGLTPARDKSGEHLSGPQSKKALEITENALFCMGMETAYEDCIGSFVEIFISKTKSKLTGDEKRNVNFNDPSTEEQYKEYRSLLLA